MVIQLPPPRPILILKAEYDWQETSLSPLLLPVPCMVL